MLDICIFIMFVWLVCLSYFLGCITTLILALCLYNRLGFSSSVRIFNQEQYESFYPRTEEEDDRTKSTTNVINDLLQFVYQEMISISEIRRSLIRKLHIELKELMETRVARWFVREIIIEEFSFGTQSPRLNNIRLLAVERDEKKLITNVVSKLNTDYRGGFFLKLDLKLIKNVRCQLHIRVKRIHGDVRLEFRHQPFSHWLAVFDREPLIDLEAKCFLFENEITVLTPILIYIIYRTIRKKQTWPSYKIRHKPFFVNATNNPLETNFIFDRSPHGKFEILVKNCDRLLIPFELFSSENRQLLSIFISLHISDEICENVLKLDRNQWTTIDFDFFPKQEKIQLKTVIYIDQQEILIENVEPILGKTDELSRAMREKNLFLHSIDGEEIRTIGRALKILQSISNVDKRRITAAIPLLNSVRISNENRNDAISTKNDVTLMMINENLFHQFNFYRTPTWEAQNNLKFDQAKPFDISCHGKYLNVYLWCQLPSMSNISVEEKQFLLLAFTTANVNRLVHDASMSFQRQTELKLNFRSPLPYEIVSKQYLSQSEFFKQQELSQHKGFNKNMTNGFVTLSVTYSPEYQNEVTFDDSIWLDEKSIDIKNENSNTVDVRNFHTKEEHSDQENRFSMSRMHAGLVRKIDQHVRPSTFSDSSNKKSERKSSKVIEKASSTLKKFNPFDSKRSEPRRKSLNTKLQTRRNISETDLQEIIDSCLSNETDKQKDLRQILHQTAVDRTSLYNEARNLAPELFRELTNEQTEEKFDDQISRVQQEIQLNHRIRDELIVEFNSLTTDERRKKEIELELASLNEKLQALGALIIFFCCGYEKALPSTKSKTNDAFKK